MAVDRNRIEQEAIALLQRGQPKNALKLYLRLLKLDPRDLRIRKQVAQLFVQMGKQAEGEKLYRSVAERLVAQGQERAAISVYKELVRLCPHDAELVGRLGECYHASRFPGEARRCYDHAIKALSSRDPAKALHFAAARVRLDPTDGPARVKLAELYEAAGQSERAIATWRELATEARRHGRADEQARFLRHALQIDPDDLDLCVEAAEAHLVAREPREALGLLEKVWKARPDDAPVLTLVARAFQALDQREKAKRVWLQAARAHEAAGDVGARVEALQAAIECGADDPEVRRMLGDADKALQAARLRLDEQPWAQPTDEPTLRAVVRARVQATYGFPERARQTLESAPPEVRGSLAARTALIEILAGAGQTDAAIALLRSLDPDDPTARAQVHARLVALGGVPAEQAGPADDLDDEPVVDEASDDLVGDDTGDESDAPAHPPPAPVNDDDPEAEGDRLAVAGRTAEAIAAYRRALAADPTNDSALMKLGELLAGTDAPPTSPDPFGDSEPFAEIESVNLDEPPESPDTDPLIEARALVYAGRPMEALALVDDRDDLEAQTIAARALLVRGQPAQALRRLGIAVSTYSADDPAWCEAVWDLADIHIQLGRLDDAADLLTRLARVAPTWRPAEVSARRRSIELMK